MKKSSAFLSCLLAACSLCLSIADASGAPPGNSPSLPSKKRILDCVSRVTGLDGNPLLAQELDGFYVIYSPTHEKPHPVWIIKMRGLPFLPLPRPFEDGINENVKRPRQHGGSDQRDYIDAITGKWMSGGVSSWSK